MLQDLDLTNFNSEFRKDFSKRKSQVKLLLKNRVTKKEPELIRLSFNDLVVYLSTYNTISKNSFYFRYKHNIETTEATYKEIYRYVDTFSAYYDDDNIAYVLPKQKTPLDTLFGESNDWELKRQKHSMVTDWFFGEMFTSGDFNGVIKRNATNKGVAFKRGSLAGALYEQLNTLIKLLAPSKKNTLYSVLSVKGKGNKCLFEVVHKGVSMYFNVRLTDTSIIFTILGHKNKEIISALTISYEALANTDLSEVVKTSFENGYKPNELEVLINPDVTAIVKKIEKINSNLEREPNNPYSSRIDEESLEKIIISEYDVPTLFANYNNLSFKKEKLADFVLIEFEGKKFVVEKTHKFGDYTLIRNEQDVINYFTRQQRKRVEKYISEQEALFNKAIKSAISIL